MKKAGLLLLALMLIWTSPVSAQDGFFVIPVPVGTGTRITSLPYTITQPGFYYLGGNLTTAEQGITISADGVTVDLMGYSITGPGTSSNQGVLVNPHTDVVIRNGTVRGFYTAVLSDPGTINCRILNITARGNTRGIEASGLVSLVSNCNATDNLNAGILVQNGQVKNCRAHNNQADGINASGDATVMDSHATSNGGAGISHNGNGNILGNTSGLNATYGFVLTGTVNRVVTGNTGYRNTTMDWSVENLAGNVLAGNTGSGLPQP